LDTNPDLHGSVLIQISGSRRAKKVPRKENDFEVLVFKELKPFFNWLGLIPEPGSC